MATAPLMLLQIFNTRFNSIASPLISYPQLQHQFSTAAASYSTLTACQWRNPKHASRVSSQGGGAEGVPTELIEDSKFVPLEADDLRYGPPAILLLGFEVQEAPKVQQLLKDMDGEFMQIIYCTEDMITGSLWEAINTRQPTLDNVEIAKSVPRICFLSGLSGEEMVMFMDAFEETELEPAVFAALVPNSADTPMQELIEEIMGDHEMVSARESESPGAG